MRAEGEGRTEGGWVILGVLVGALTTGLLNLFFQSRQFKHNVEMHQLENQSCENVKALLIEKLNHPTYTDRSFKALKKNIGGFKDDEIRLLLHEIDAVQVNNDKGEEYWYLRSRADERTKVNA